jgi:sugar/nucleoside kinase (ribokinase family)
LQLHAGGSLANTLAACGALSRAATLRTPGAQTPQVAMAGAVGADHLGSFFRSEAAASGVDWLSMPSPPGSATGTVIVLTTRDAQRSFLSYPAATQRVGLCPHAAAAATTARVLVIEGYLWELPGAVDAIARAVALARAGGALVAVTAADVSVVRRHRHAMLSALRGADVVFANATEAAALLGDDAPEATARGAGHHLATEALARGLGALCCGGTAVVTDGSRGSVIVAGGALHVVPPCWAASAPVDTCGAGDAYAAGFLYGLVTGLPVRRAGELAAAAASAVIARPGPELPMAAAAALVEAFAPPASQHTSEHDADLLPEAVLDHSLVRRAWL